MHKLLVLLLLLNACNTVEHKMIKSIPLIQAYIDSPNIEEIVRQGLMDGCVSGSAARGNSFYKTTLYFRQDVRKIYDAKYIFAWKDGYSMCFIESNQYSFQRFGARAIKTNHPISWIAPVNAGATVPIGGDAESRPAVWYFDEPIDKGIPTNANYGTPENIYGFFGSCYLC